MPRRAGPPPRTGAAGVALGMAGLLTALAAGKAAVLYPDGPPPGHTGGFGEPTCLECHFDGPLNPPEGTVAVDGLPAWYVPGRTYALRVELRHPALVTAGFQLAVRFADGAEAGRQAGRLSAGEDAVDVVVVDSAGVAYAQHTRAGTVPASAGAAAWVVLWTAPETGHPVVVHVAANAANDDASEFGDNVYAAAVRVAGAQGL